MAKRKPCDLAGLSILVTRPSEQAANLSEAIQAIRGRPISFPALEILGPVDKKVVRSQLANLKQTNLLIFVSANAVRYAFPQLPDNMPLDQSIAAIGKATASALEEVGLDPTLQPKGSMDSEGLLALPQLQDVEGQRILIVRGNGGREALKETLEQRGAHVEYVEAYRRQIPKRNPSNLIRGWQQMVEVVIATSNNILDNLLTLLGEEGSALLRQTPLVVVSKRMAEHAAEQGCQIVYIANSAMDNDILDTLCEINATL